MDGNNSSNVVMDFDLNEEPEITPPSDSDSDTNEGADHRSPNDSVSESMPVEQRITFIHHLSNHMSKRPRLDQGGPSGESLKFCNTRRRYNYDGSRLVAKALERERLDREKEAAAKFEKKGGGFYDCNVCFELAKEPVLTCCGHLFCWSCFYKIPYVDSFAKECPVCVGEVSDSTVIPIYGNNGGLKNDCNNEVSTALKIPPRPKARRVERVRTQRVANVSHVPVAVL